MKGLNEHLVLFAMLLLLLLLSVLVAPLTAASEAALQPNSHYSRPMMALELDAARASSHFLEWETAKDKLRDALHWDFLFLLIYPALVSVPCFMAGRYWAGQNVIPMGITLVVITLQLVAGVLDAIEDTALLRVLDGCDISAWAIVARWCAIGKFTLVTLGAGYGLLGGGAALVSAWMRR
jgi:hypothetical protein